MTSKQLEAKCRCGSVNFAIELQKEKLPVGINICHCSICRYFSGAPSIFHCPLPQETKITWINGSSKDKMTDYVPSGGVASVHFCSRCGCHITSIDLETAQWYMSPSITNDTNHEFFKFSANAFTKSAKDGGISSMLETMGDRQLVEWNPAETEDCSKVVENQAEVGEDGESRLRAQCHCGGVSFTIKRPSEEVLKDDFMSGFVSPEDSTKWLACLDVCGDCRLVTGTHVIGWSFVSMASIEPAIGHDLVVGTAKTYSSSPGVLRSFCGQCGATIFFACDDRLAEGKEIVDIATGILRAPEGPMAESWLTWRSKVAHIVSGSEYDEEFATSLQKGMDKWSNKKYGKTMDFNIG